MATADAETHAADGGTDIRLFSFRELLRHRGDEPTRTPPNGERPSLRNSAGSLSVHRLPQDPAYTRARELRALTAAAQDHSRAVRRLLVLDRDALTRVNAPGVEVQPAYEWLLTTPNQG